MDSIKVIFIVFIAGITLIFAGGANLNEKGIVEDQICELVTELKTNFSEDPSFNPFFLDLLLLQQTDENFMCDLVLRNLILWGIPDIEVPYEKIDADIILRWVKIGIILNMKASAEYEGWANLLQIINLEGQGNLYLDLRDLYIEVKVTRELLPSNETIQLSEVTLLNTSIDVNSKIRFTGLYGDEEISEIISEDLTSILIEMLNNDTEYLNKLLSEPVKNLINGLINFTLEDLTALIG